MAPALGWAQGNTRPRSQPTSQAPRCQQALKTEGRVEGVGWGEVWASRHPQIYERALHCNGLGHKRPDASNQKTVHAGRERGAEGEKRAGPLLARVRMRGS